MFNVLYNPGAGLTTLDLVISIRLTWNCNLFDYVPMYIFVWCVGKEKYVKLYNIWRGHHKVTYKSGHVSKEQWEGLQKLTH